MYSSYTTLISFIALLAANQVIGATIAQPPPSVAGPQIATSPYYACNKPNNGNHHEGSSCKYYSGPSDNSGIISGKCEWVNGSLYCVA